MERRLVFRSQLPGPDTAGDAVFLGDLGFPCHLECAPCRRYRRPSPRELPELQRALERAIAARSGGSMRAVFFGGDVFARPSQLAQLLGAVRRACRAAGVHFEAAAFSDGVGWEDALVRRFHRLGVRHLQVVLDGPAGIHDVVRPLRGGGGSFARILHSVEHHRGPAQVIVRVDPIVGGDALTELLDVLDGRGLFGGPNPVVVLVSAPSHYAREARELLQVIDLLSAPASGLAPVPSHHPT